MEPLHEGRFLARWTEIVGRCYQPITVVLEITQALLQQKQSKPAELFGQLLAAFLNVCSNKILCIVF